jgi:putative flavoprotein involved in K+ transport
VPEPVETVIVGGGQAGLSMSYHLGQLGREHVVLERGRIAERWRSERWDSLAFQFPNWMMRLPGYAYEGNEPEGFMHRNGVVRFIDEYARRIAPPIRCGIRVTKLASSKTGRLHVETDHSTLEAINVVVATGPYQLPSVPAFSTALPFATYQVTANRYINPGELPPGNVLVVGSGGSGCQIAEDLLRAGRSVFLSVGRHRRVPRRYRGKDFGWWQEKTGASDRTVDSLPPDARAPLLTGANGGHDVDLRHLARQGVTLAGSLRDISRSRLLFAADLEENLARGDETFDQFTRSVDEYILKHRLSAPAEPQWHPHVTVRPPTQSAIRDLDIRAAGITSVIWATGYQYDFGWVRCAVLDASGKPVHRRGVTAMPGVYFLGLPRLHTVKSAFLWGVGEDAAYLAQHIVTRV